MNRVKILDCTLRDGGYINDFNFGEKNIKEIVRKLSKASIDIIECGFLKSNSFNPDRSLFGSINAVKNYISEKNPNVLYVGMIQFGEIKNEEISKYDGTSIDGIRLTFHEHEINESFVFGRQLIDKGYKVFMQPVGTMTYSDEALLHLINRINELKPFAFYLVDTLGTMYKNDLLRMYYLVDHNLNKKIAVGFHSHNNLQLCFANAQELMQLNSPRSLIIDSSIYGMGRGAGNLNTELVTQYINSNFKYKYDNLEILEIIEHYIKPLSLHYKWGYDVAYYIASITGCHPNYASFLINKKTMRVQDIYTLLRNIHSDKRAIFDKKYIGEEYLSFMGHHIDDYATQMKVRSDIGDRKVLLLAPGKSLQVYMREIESLVAEENFFVISVNFVPKDIAVDMAFVSNMRRFDNLDELVLDSIQNFTVIVTSNITTIPKSNLNVVNYLTYVNDEQCIADNAGLMCINFLNKIGIKKLLLAGFDGFSSNFKENYFEDTLSLDTESEKILQMNIATEKKLSQLSAQIKITYLTTSIYET